MKFVLFKLPDYWKHLIEAVNYLYHVSQ